MELYSISSVVLSGYINQQRTTSFRSELTLLTSFLDVDFITKSESWRARMAQPRRPAGYYISDAMSGILNTAYLILCHGILECGFFDVPSVDALAPFRQAVHANLSALVLPCLIHAEPAFQVNVLVLIPIVKR